MVEHLFLCVMTVFEARDLLTPLPYCMTRPDHWMDLGCGTGTFTLALAELLPPGSTITAVDRDERTLRSLPTEHNGVRIVPQTGDAETMRLPSVDGILMANLLHFIPDQRAFLHRIAQATDRVLLAEYDTDRARPPWVPFPVSRRSAVELFAETGFTDTAKLGTRQSQYGPELLYAAAFSKPDP